MRWPFGIPVLEQSWFATKEFIWQFLKLLATNAQLSCLVSKLKLDLRQWNPIHIDPSSKLANKLRNHAIEKKLANFDTENSNWVKDYGA